MAEGQMEDTGARKAVPRPPNAEEFEAQPEFAKFKNVMRAPSRAKE